jgi:hypothetical protein
MAQPWRKRESVMSAARRDRKSCLRVHRGTPTFRATAASRVQEVAMSSLSFRPGLALVAALFAGAASAQSGYGYGYGNDYGHDRVRVRCESIDERTRYCTADIRGRVRLVDQLSRSQCIEGRTWGWDRQGIWVSQGCRAEFEIEYAYDDRYYDRDRDYYDRNRREYGQGRVFRCESNDSRTNYCDVDTRYGVRLLTQHSRAACIEGRTWCWNSRGVWVTDGCRAQFQVGSHGYDGRYDDRYRDPYGYGRDPYGYGNQYGRTLTCSSNDNRYNFCRLGGGVRQVQIRRQLSQSECRYNYSWGWRNDGVWVDRGCRAEFMVY